MNDILDTFLSPHHVTPKPPRGVTPRFVYRQNRCVELAAGISRYLEGTSPTKMDEEFFRNLKEWSKELTNHLMDLESEPNK